MRNIYKIPAMVLILTVLLERSAFACSVCFGDPNSSMTAGLNMGILSLLLVVLVVWIGTAAFFIRLAKKSKIHA